MRNWCLTFCLVLTAFFGSVGVSSALPTCKGSYNSKTWTNCFGTNISQRGKYSGEWKNGKAHGNGTFVLGRKICIGKICYPAGLKFTGQFRNDAVNGYGIATFPNGTRQKGIWKNNLFSYATPKAVWLAFHQLSNAKRKRVQKELSDYGFYKSSIDGLYGPGTFKALSAYNKKYLANADLSKAANALKLLNAIIESNTTTLVKKKTCAEDVRVCATAMLCSLSTTSNSGIKVWETRYNYKKHVTEAKRRRLTCGVTETVAKKKTCAEDVRVCATAMLCSLSTTSKSGIKVWETRYKYKKHVAEAKRRGLTCGVTETVAKKKVCSADATACNNEQICHYSTHGPPSQKKWSTSYWRKHVTEAKRRGLTCGVTETIAKKKPNPYSGLPDCPSSTDVIWTNCFATYTGKEGGTYEGEWKDDEYHGMGTYTYPDGTKYVGQFKKQEFDGKGTLTTAEGSKYVGSFLKDKFHGKGTFTFPDGTKYVGDFLNDQFHGKGEFTFGSTTKNAGDIYVGEFKEDKFHGKGIYTKKDGTVIKGVWKDDELQNLEEQSPKVTSKDRTDDDEVISASSGSGFAVSYDGHVITNNHVIEGCQEVAVHHKGDEIPAKVITYDTQNDLALLKGDFVPETVFPLSVERPELLQDVYVAGYPFGKEISTSVKVTKGIISSLTGIGNNFSNMQIDAALQPGNSGGPILDEKGNLVGVAVAKLDLDYIMENYGVVPEGTNFGIKSNVVRNLLDSNEVDNPSASRSSISKTKLGKKIASGTYYISCLMTMAQIEAMESKKVMFSNLK